MNNVFFRRQEQLKRQVAEDAKIDQISASCPTVAFSLMKTLRELNRHQSQKLESEPFWRYFSVLESNMDQLDTVSAQLEEVKTCKDLALLSLHIKQKMLETN